MTQPAKKPSVRRGAVMPDIDKLARAAFEAFWGDWLPNTMGWEQQPDEYKENWRNVVKAVLEAKDQP